MSDRTITILFAIWFAFVGLVVCAGMGFGVWVIYSLVEWVTSK